MKTSRESLEKIAEFEGVRLTAYRCPAGVLTVGIGHTGPEVVEGMTITHERAMEYFAQDIRSAEIAVEHAGLQLDQGKYDALVSFCYNCGQGNFQKLTRGRTLAQIASAIPSYNKARDPKTGKMVVLAGLVRRRAWERELFLAGGIPDQKEGNPYQIPDKTLKNGSKGNGVRWLQYELNRRGFGLIVDGVFGQKTEDAVRMYQNQRKLISDGIVGARTRAELENGK